MQVKESIMYKKEGNVNVLSLSPLKKSMLRSIVIFLHQQDYIKKKLCSFLLYSFIKNSITLIRLTYVLANKRIADQCGK